MPLLLLIRHALTESTGRSLSGWAPGVHLSERGREQAAALADFLSPIPVGAVYSSPLERCTETASAIAVGRRIKVRVASDLGEVRYGDWTGRSLSQLSRTRLWKVVQTVPSAAHFPNGESLLEVQDRAVHEIARIAKTHPRGIVAAVSHGDPIKLVLAHFAGAHTDMFQRFVVQPASVSVILVGEGIPRILRVNSTGSLSDLIPPKRRSVRG